jgi:hypothetical protein
MRLVSQVDLRMSFYEYNTIKYNIIRYVLTMFSICLYNYTQTIIVVMLIGYYHGTLLTFEKYCTIIISIIISDRHCRTDTLASLAACMALWFSVYYYYLLFYKFIM